MKIEIAENLVYSYLKHVEGCRIVQTNWKKSSRWKITEYEKTQSRELFEKIRTSHKFENIFKNCSFNQILKQAEVDVIGINPIENSVFGIDVAFHEAGVNYGNTCETTERIFMKIFRTIFILQTYFGGFNKFNSYFITPKANPATLKPINELIEEANSIINDENISISFIANSDFYRIIIDPILENIHEDSDTSELFLRSIKLIQLDITKRKIKILSEDPIIENEISRPRMLINKKEVGGMKIGQFVQNTMRVLHEEKAIPSTEIKNLQDKSYSKKVFDQNYEILRRKFKNITSPDGRTRYYSKEYFFDEYYLTSQWHERHWEKFLIWYKSIKNIE